MHRLLKRKRHPQGLTKRGDRKNIFRITRFKNDHGFYVYALENTAEGRKIIIPRFLFGQFRACVREIVADQNTHKTPSPFERSVSFLNREYFYFKSSRMDLDNLIIQDIEERSGSSGYITVGRRSLGALDGLLYSDALAHPNDVLESIISYHKLFQFSFVKGSKSITSNLALRRDVLQRVTNYRPSLAEKVVSNKNSPVTKALSSHSHSALSKTGKAGSDYFQPKLGERFHEKDIRVDYGEIFGDKKVLLGQKDEPDSVKESKTNATLLQFSIPISTQEIKEFRESKFYFELDAQRSNDFRTQFIGDRTSDFYLGFEIVDSLFTLNKTLKSFQFPLYYMRIRIRESGRGVHLESTEDGRIYLNHLALAHLVEKFSSKGAGVDAIDEFFKTLLAQHISVDQLNDRITLIRYLPVSHDIFDRTREILFGYADENGLGGILGDLKFSGVECDLHSVNLYRAPKQLAPLDQALEHDLDSIHFIAHKKMHRFYDSLLGRFLTPELEFNRHTANRPAEPTWVPGSLPGSTRKLFERLHRHDLVLLEGPPGTGKTYTILNLLIHHICSKKRVLIVSDQQGAIEALVEKVQQYLSTERSRYSGGKNHIDLLFNAIKIIDEVDVSTESLPDVLDKLAKSFKASDMGTFSIRKNLERKLEVVDQKITQLGTVISGKMSRHMGEHVAFENIEPYKSESQTDVSSLNEFLAILLDIQNKYRLLLIDFVSYRRELIDDGMEDCYAFFSLPLENTDTDRTDDDIRILNGDTALLSKLSKLALESKEEFYNIIGNSPRHELIRQLEKVFEEQSRKPESGLKRVAKRINRSFRSDLQKQSQLFLEMVKHHVKILQFSKSCSSGLWRLLRGVHECIRVNDRPNQALALYYSVLRKLDGIAGDARISIQSDLEEIAELYVQRDTLVYERFVSSLHEITQQATTAKRTSGTDASTRIMALVEDLKQFSSIPESGAVFDEFKQALYETFPVWIVRKQLVPLLLPCTEQSFDLVVIDEATQCRVDDAMSLLFRAKKLMVVGDDKQTVLQKNSSTDDYLFKDHELDEHLRSTQARGFKGGGSNIFALVKSIKQASVMLDEHYRCPPEIIEFSNKYVYDDELKVMQWRLPEHSCPVVVDSSEFKVESSKKATGGKFKGIETQMVDRFMDYVASTIADIEKNTGKTVNVETDVALCYFLMKNEPYVKCVKDKLLQKLKRGDILLDGAGAALQGKERDYIFYLWDVTRYNLGAFSQGDDEEKRKGELNVLMSRPKNKAFHFLHRNFEQLDHSRSTITHYLWRAYLRQQQSEDLARSRIEIQSGSLFLSLLKFTLENSSQRGIKEALMRIQKQSIDFRTDIVVGDPLKLVDVIAFSKEAKDSTIGLVDLSAFGAESNASEAIIDYYFQLKRAVPNIDPVFMFPYELVDDGCEAFRSLLQKLMLV